MYVSKRAVTGSDLISGYVAVSNAPPGQPTVVSATKEAAAEIDAVKILYKREHSRSTALQTTKSHAALSTQQPQELASSNALNRGIAVTVSLVLVCVTLAMFAFGGSPAGAQGGGEGRRVGGRAGGRVGGWQGGIDARRNRPEFRRFIHLRHWFPRSTSRTRRWCSR